MFLKAEPEVRRGVEKSCLDCSKKFTVLTRQHQCKRCLKAVCSQCGKYHCQVFNEASPVKEIHRVCKNCKESSDYITGLVQKQNLVFGKMSNMGLEWLNKIKKQSIVKDIDATHHRLFNQDIFRQLWRSFSFEMRELIGLLTANYQKKGLFQMVHKVYTCVISAFPHLSAAKVLPIIMYCLCFCSQDKASILVIYLIQLSQQQKQLKQTAIALVKAMPYHNQYPRFEQYAHHRFDKNIHSFFINCVTIEASVSLITKTLQNKSMEGLLMYFSSHLYVNREMLALITYDTPKQLVDLFMLRNCNLREVTSNYIHLNNKNLPSKLSQESTNASLNIAKKLQAQKKMVRDNSSGVVSLPDLSLGLQEAMKDISFQEEPNGKDDSFSVQSLGLQDLGDYQKRRFSKDSQHSIGSFDVQHLKTEVRPKQQLKLNGQECQKCDYYRRESQNLNQKLLQLQKYQKLPKIVALLKTQNKHLEEKLTKQIELNRILEAKLSKFKALYDKAEEQIIKFKSTIAAEQDRYMNLQTRLVECQQKLSTQRQNYQLLLSKTQGKNRKEDDHEELQTKIKYLQDQLQNKYKECEVFLSQRNQLKSNNTKLSTSLEKKEQKLKKQKQKYNILAQQLQEARQCLQAQKQKQKSYGKMNPQSNTQTEVKLHNIQKQLQNMKIENQTLKIELSQAQLTIERHQQELKCNQDVSRKQIQKELNLKSQKIEKLALRLRESQKKEANLMKKLQQFSYLMMEIEAEKVDLDNQNALLKEQLRSSGMKEAIQSHS